MGVNAYGQLLFLTDMSEIRVTDMVDAYNENEASLPEL